MRIVAHNQPYKPSRKDNGDWCRRTKDLQKMARIKQKYDDAAAKQKAAERNRKQRPGR